MHKNTALGLIFILLVVARISEVTGGFQIIFAKEVQNTCPKFVGPFFNERLWRELNKKTHFKKINLGSLRPKQL